MSEIHGPTFPVDPGIAESQPVARDEDPEEVISDLDARSSEARPTLSVSIPALRAAFEGALSIKSDRVHLSTTATPEVRLWIWAEREGCAGITALPWDSGFPVSTELSHDEVRNLVKSLAGQRGALTRYLTVEGCVIGGICIPWTTEVPGKPHWIDFNSENWFHLNHRLLDCLVSSNTAVLTYDFPEAALRLVPDSEKPPAHLTIVGTGPACDMQSRFAVSDLRLLAGGGKRNTRVFCDSPGGGNRVRLVSLRESTRDHTEIRMWTAVTGDECEHPPRYEVGPHPIEVLDLGEDEKLNDIPSAQVLANGKASCDSEGTVSGTIVDVVPAWTNQVWHPWNAACQDQGDDQWVEPLSWDMEARAAGIPTFVFVDCGDVDLLDEDPTLNPLRERAWGIMTQCKNLVWQICTRKPENFESLIFEQPWFGEWPDNIWPGINCTSQAEANVRMPELVALPTKFHWVLAQPLLGMIRFDEWIDQLDQIVVGGERVQRGATDESLDDPAPLNPDWVRAVRFACGATKKSFFFHQWGDARDDQNHLVEVLGRNCSVPWLNGGTWTKIPGIDEKFKPMARSFGRKKAVPHLPLEPVPNVGVNIDSGGGVRVVVVDGANAPNEKSTFEAIFAYIKELCAAREDFESEFDIAVARLLLRAKRDFDRRGKKEDFELMASELSGVPRSMVPKYLQIAREVSLDQWRQIPEKHRKVKHLLALVRLMKRDVALVDALHQLDEPRESLEPVVSASAIEEAAPKEQPAVEPRKRRRGRTRGVDVLQELIPNGHPWKVPLPGYNVTVGLPLEGVIATREYLERVLRERPEAVSLALLEAQVVVRIQTKPIGQDI